MNILIAGASGFIGTELVNSLKSEHELTVLGRDFDHLKKCFSEHVNKVTWNHLDSLDARNFNLIINLSGSNIGAKRWSKKVKNELINSRVLSNEKLINWISRVNAKPRFFCANAVGIYGLQSKSDNSSFDESATINFKERSDFLNEIGVAWQKSLEPAVDIGLDVVTLRFGVVLKKGQGMLKKLELPYSLGLGSVLGDGKQNISWIHIEDVIAAINYVISHKDITGPVNVTSPNPVTQKEFARIFAKTLKRPLFFKTPSFVIRAIFGEMGECLLLGGQRVIPKRLNDLGFEFKYPLLDATLEYEYQ